MSTEMTRFPFYICRRRADCDFVGARACAENETRTRCNALMHAACKAVRARVRQWRGCIICYTRISKLSTRASLRFLRPPSRRG